MIRINVAGESGSRGPRVSLQLGFNLGLLFGVIYLVAILGGGIYWLSLTNEESRLRTQIERDSQELTMLKTTIGQGAKIKEQLAELKKRVQTIETLTKNQARPIRLLDAFADTLPSDLWITGIEEKAEVLKISGSAFSTTAVADFMTNLRSSGRFREVDIVVSRSDLAKMPRLVTFEVTCRFEG